jgi:lipid II:glycine glycyltransferase (peptidoglycan interpeptide bridge formation enzyme)
VTVDGRKQRREKLTKRWEKFDRNAMIKRERKGQKVAMLGEELVNHFSGVAVKKSTEKK